MKIDEEIMDVPFPAGILNYRIILEAGTPRASTQRRREEEGECCISLRRRGNGKCGEKLSLLIM